MLKGFIEGFYGYMVYILFFVGLRYGSYLCFEIVIIEYL